MGRYKLFLKDVLKEIDCYVISEKKRKIRIIGNSTCSSKLTAELNKRGIEYYFFENCNSLELGNLDYKVDLRKIDLV